MKEKFSGSSLVTVHDNTDALKKVASGSMSLKAANF